MTNSNVGSMNRRKFLGTAAASALTTVGSSTLISQAVAGNKYAPHKTPNILFILADDLGWGDLSIYGRPDYQTPNLDRLARQGARFTNAYSAQTVCTPTRVGFLTGRYPARLEVGLREPLGNISQVGSTVGLPPSHPTVASLLKARGYETALVGKWHLGYLPNYGPNKSGFDKFFGHFSGGIDYFSHKDGSGVLDFYNDEQLISVPGYTTELFTEKAIAFIKKPRNQPFYLSLHYNAPHWPWEGPGDESLSTTLYSNGNYTAGGSPEIYAAMIKSLDDGVGKVLQALEETGQANNTLVIFVSDNGGERYSFFGPFRNRKGSLNEGGIRVPTIIRWPGKVKPNQVNDQPTITMDLTATILAATRVPAAPKYPLDGVNLLPALIGEKRLDSRPLFWRYRSGINIQGAVRLGNWKYLQQGSNQGLNQFLYDLESDPGEQTDLKESHPKIFRHLQRQFDRWQFEVLPVAQFPA
ncbi:twin-arginine translocation pathway signal protein [Nostoc minutum NIES-26]|uniref:Twin-arginine translocation pathway signal protein n=1 Tax=Nostoc minutum NIES-26 TaxID=1844469 RepID=A0A367QUY6_9NOSO|nr:twin-arginine translocation pathway signal protein [Nostoc minutum NIES-26]